MCCRQDVLLRIWPVGGGGASHRQSVEFAAGLITFGGVFVALPSKRGATVGSASSSMLLAGETVGSDERRVCADTSDWPA